MIADFYIRWTVQQTIYNQRFQTSDGQKNIVAYYAVHGGSEKHLLDHDSYFYNSEDESFTKMIYVDDEGSRAKKNV